MNASVSQAFEWHYHPDALAMLIVLVGAFLVTSHVLGPRVAPDAPPNARHYFCYLSGVFALWLGADWPLHELAEGYLYSAHMIQHLLFTFIAPPLLLLGLPKWLLRSALDAVGLEGALRALTRPLVALILFNVTIAVTHWPALVDASLRSEPLHFGVHLALVCTSLLMWWPVVDPLPEMSRLSEPGKMLYLFLQSVLPTVPASFLT
ncbi:MAG: cytochrome c oxidase assembly protein, partial [Actinomycetota bacterium]